VNGGGCLTDATPENVFARWRIGADTGRQAENWKMGPIPAAIKLPENIFRLLAPNQADPCPLPSRRLIALFESHVQCASIARRVTIRVASRCAKTSACCAR